MGNARGTCLKTKDEVEKILLTFFAPSIALADLFIQLWEYSKTLNPDLVVRYNNEIIGISETDSVFCFYISFSDSNYYIKFKHQQKKLLFQAESIETYMDLCKDIVPLIKDNPKYHTKTVQKERENKKLINKNDEYMAKIKEHLAEIDRQNYLPGCNEALLKCNDIFEYHKNKKLSKLLFGNRAVNALSRSGVITYGDLKNQDAISLSRIKDLGRKSIQSIIKGCHSISTSEEDLIQIAQIHENTTNDISANENINTRSSIPSPWNEVHQKINQHMQMDLNFHFHETVPENVLMNIIREIISFFDEVFQNPYYFTDYKGEILHQRIIEDKTLAEVGELYELSRERIRQLEKKSLTTFSLRLQRGKIHPEQKSKLHSLLISIPDDYLLFFLVNLRQKYAKIWVCLSKLLTDSEKQELLITQMDIVQNEMRLRNQSSGEVSEHLPELLEQLNSIGKYQSAIDVGKYYTDLFGKSIWSSELFASIAKAYQALGYMNVANQFEALAKKLSFL